jgi:hypothetical protein
MLGMAISQEVNSEELPPEAFDELVMAMVRNGFFVQEM